MQKFYMLSTVVNSLLPGDERATFTLIKEQANLLIGENYMKSFNQSLRGGLSDFLGQMSNDFPLMSTLTQSLDQIQERPYSMLEIGQATENAKFSDAPHCPEETELNDVKAAPTQIPLTKVGQAVNLDVSKARRYSDPIEMG
ncbi:hypothetical protein STEG23_000340, partial [Scotinomys teguina]